MFRYTLVIYLFYQAIGQISVLMNRESISEYASLHRLSEKEKRNLKLVEEVKSYSTDSLAYLPTQNFTQVYYQNNSPSLWVITASEPFALKAYEWEFPLIGKVSYKGFFKKDLAEKELNRLRAMNYDVDLRPVSAWSTLGWFNDPVLSSMLKKSKGGICNLLFHELFHATYYAPSSVDLNENMASFVAHKATLQFLKNDTAALREYLDNEKDNELINNFMTRQNVYLKKYYKEIENSKDRLPLKLRIIQHIADSLNFLPVKNKKLLEMHREQVLEQKNAYFIDFEQYDGKQDSLDEAFNKFYKGDLKKMVQDLKRKSNYY
jgi:predicted aminopeptidase